MGKSMLAGAVVVALSGPASAGSPPPIDIFDGLFASRATALHPELKPTSGICDDSRHCMIGAAPGVIVLFHAPAAADGVDGATVVAPYDGLAASKAFSGTCDALIALLSTGVSDAERRSILAELLDGAERTGTAERSSGGISYRAELRDDHRIVLTARPAA